MDIPTGSQIISPAISKDVGDFGEREILQCHNLYFSGTSSSFIIGTATVKMSFSQIKKKHIRDTCIHLKFSYLC